MDSNTKVRLCPFCGQSPRIDRAGSLLDESHVLIAYCAKCGFGIPVDIWQTRALDLSARTIDSLVATDLAVELTAKVGRAVLNKTARQILASAMPRIVEERNDLLSRIDLLSAALDNLQASLHDLEKHRASYMDTMSSLRPLSASVPEVFTRLVQALEDDPDIRELLGRGVWEWIDECREAMTQLEAIRNEEA